MSGSSNVWDAACAALNVGAHEQAERQQVESVLHVKTD